MLLMHDYIKKIYVTIRLNNFFGCIKRWIYLATISIWRNVKLRSDYKQVEYVMYSAIGGCGNT